MLRYLLPALIPSWRFFDSVGPSPRIEYCLLANEADTGFWQPFRPQPAHVPLTTLCRQLLWNPARNEDLYLLSSCEKILERGSLQAQQVIAGRIAQALQSGEITLPPQARGFRFRLLVLMRGDAGIECHEQFVSPVFIVDREWKPLP